MKYSFWGVLIFLLVTASSFAAFNGYENENDEQINTYLQQAGKFIGTDPQKAKAYIDSASVRFTKETDKGLYAEYCYLLSVHYLNVNNIGKSIEYSFQAHNYFKGTDNFKRLADCNFVMGRCHIIYSNTKEGIAELLRASAIYDSLKLVKDFIKVQTSLGKGFYYLKDYTKAKEYFIKVKKYADQKHDTLSLLASLNNLGVIYDDEEGRGNREAMKYYLQAIKICESMRSETKVIPFYSNMGFNYFMRNKTDSAFYFYRKAWSLAQKHKQYDLQMTLAGNLGQYYNKKQMYDSAMFFVNNGLKMQMGLGQKISVKDLLLLKSEILNNQKRYPEAYRVLKESNHWQDSLYNEQIFKSASEIEAKFENQKKIQQLEMQKKEIDTQKAQTKMLFVVLGLLVLLILSSVYFLLKISRVNKSLKYKNQTINQTNKELKETIRIRDKLTSVIAHDIRNPLGTIAGFAELSLSTPAEDADKLHRFSENILKSSSRLLELLENLLQWTKSQNQGIKVNLQNFAIEEIINDNLKLLYHMAADKQISFHNLCNNRLTVIADRQMLSTVLRNLITNAVKFTNNEGWIRMDSFVEEGYVRIDIKDNGVGISKANIDKLFDAGADRMNLSKSSNKGSGFGLLLCNDFMKLNKGFINVTSEEGKGSCFSVYIPQGGLLYDTNS